MVTNVELLRQGYVRAPGRFEACPCRNPALLARQGGDLQTLRNMLISVEAPLAEGVAESLVFDLNYGSGARLVCPVPRWLRGAQFCRI